MRNINKGTKAPYKGVLLTQKEYKKYEKTIDELLPVAQEIIEELKLKKDLGHKELVN